jgi:hypothetical protein
MSLTDHVVHDTLGSQVNQEMRKKVISKIEKEKYFQKNSKIPLVRCSEKKQRMLEKGKYDCDRNSKGKMTKKQEMQRSSRNTEDKM